MHTHFCDSCGSKCEVDHLYTRQDIWSHRRGFCTRLSAVNAAEYFLPCRSRYYAPYYRVCFWFVQDNIKDKMRSIPVEVSAEIVGTKRQKTRNGLPQLMPVLDSSQPSKDVIEVNIQTTTLSSWQNVYSGAKFIYVVICCCCCRSTL